MLTLTDVKHALRIDSDIDDAYLDKLMQSADSYMRSAITDYDELREESAETETNDFNAKADIVQLAIIMELYEHRVADNRTMPYSTVIRYMINQLQYTAKKETEEDG